MPLTKVESEKVKGLIDMSVKGYDNPFTNEELEIARKVTMGDCILEFGLTPTEANRFLVRVELSERRNKAVGFRYGRHSNEIKESKGAPAMKRTQSISGLPRHLQGPLRRALVECGCQDMGEYEMPHQTSDYHPVETDHGTQFEDSDAYEESGMIKSNLYSIASKAQSLHDMVKDGDDLPEWVQEKIAVCDEYMDVIHDYLKYEYKTTGGHLGESKASKRKK